MSLIFFLFLWRSTFLTHILFLLLKFFLDVSGKAGLLATNSLNFCLSGKIFTFGRQFHRVDNFRLVDFFFSSSHNTLNISLHSLAILWFLRSWMWSLSSLFYFPLMSFRVFSFNLHFLSSGKNICQGIVGFCFLLYWYSSCVVFCGLPESIFWCLTLIWEI